MEREPLDVAALRAELADTVSSVDVVRRTGSTNADLLAAARAGAPGGTVLVTEYQDAGRGRLARSWVSPLAAGLTFSVLVRPDGVPPARWGWLPLLAGLSLLRTVREQTGLCAALKWPNDLLLGAAPAKCAGILAEALAGDAPAVVIGIGLNVDTRLDELPVGATSLAAEGAAVGRTELLAALLRRLLADEAVWRRAGGDPDTAGLRTAYRQACATVGAGVRIELPDGGAEVATAVDVDREGRLVVRSTDGATRAVAAGDVVHLRALP